MGFTRNKACHCGIVGPVAAGAAAGGNRSRWPLRPTRYGEWTSSVTRFFDGRRFRLLPVLDHFTHECPDIVVDQSLRADDVAAAVARLVVQPGKREAIKVDNGSGFAGKVMDRWEYENGVELDFSPRGTPTDNAMVESFNGRLRQECLNAHWFLSLADARSKIEAWRKFYSEQRSHRALAWKTPAAFAR
ncbi:transposase family protein [Xanthomonas vasicola]|nr:transposase family protein [Xanthomonas vasicola]